MSAHEKSQRNESSVTSESAGQEGATRSPAPFQLANAGNSSAPVPANPVPGVMSAPPFQLQASGEGAEMCSEEINISVEPDGQMSHADGCEGGGDGSNPTPPPPPTVNIVSPNPIMVDFTASHRMAQYGGDQRNNPTWRPGSPDHAAAYTVNTSPNVDAQFGLGAGTELAGNTEATVRVLENGAEIGRKDNASITSSLLSVAGLNLMGLAGKDAVRSFDNVLTWQVTLDGANWTDLGNSGQHRLYWLTGAPTIGGATNFAIDKATGFANGNADVAGSIRSGMRGVINYDPADAINPDPLSVFADGVGICTDFGNLLVLLAQSIGMRANPVMFFGGFESLGRNVWISRGGNYQNLTDVKALDNAYHPGGGAAGWDFNYHVIARINGALQDAALNRPGYDAQAVHGGKMVHLLELAPANLPAAQVGVPYRATIPRVGHQVAVTLREYGNYITNAAFDPANLIALKVPEATPSPISVGVNWTPGAGIPAGLAIVNAQGEIAGTPTNAGNFNFDVNTAGAGAGDNGQFSINVNP